MKAKSAIPEFQSSPVTGIDATRPVGLLGRLALLAVALLLAGQVALAWFAVSGFERELEPQLNQKAYAVGVAVAEQFKFAIGDLGIPPDKLVGIDDFFDSTLNTNSDIEYLALLDAQSRALFTRGLPVDALQRMLPDIPGAEAEIGQRTEVAGFFDSAFPVATDSGVSAVLHVGISKEYVRIRLSEILYEIITVIVISWLVTLEFLMFFMNTRISEPMQLITGAMAEGGRGIFANRFALQTRDEIGQVVLGFNRMLRDLRNRHEDLSFEAMEVRGAQIDEGIATRIQAAFNRVSERYRFAGGATLWPRSAMQIRVPLFLFIFAEELSRSFLPLFVARFSPTDAFVSDELLIGLPITLFMLVVAMVTPIGGTITDRIGARRVFLVGITFAVVGYIGTAFVWGYYDLLLWRVITGAGYGLLYIAAQVWVTNHTAKENRAQGMAVFATAIFVGAICGPPIGSIVADRIGFEATFLISAVVSVISGLIVYQVMNDGDKSEHRTPHTGLGAREWRTLLADRRFLSVTVFAAVPAKLVLTGFLFYIVPLYLSDLGHRQASIGWVVMLYGIATVSCTSLAARYADHTNGYSIMVLVGGALPGIGCALALFQDSMGGGSIAVVIAVFALGLGHALALTSQLSIAQGVAEQYTDSMGPASVIAAFRFVERAGLVLGPLVAGVLVAAFDYQGAMVGIGIIILVSITIYGLLTRLPTPEARDLAERVAGR